VELARSLGHRPAVPPGAAGWALWISGRPGSGKTTLASEVPARLVARGIESVVVEVTDFVSLIAPDGCVAPLQREVVTRAVVAAARLLVDTGLAVIIDGCTPLCEADAIARAHLDDFAHVELMCPPELGRTRERAVRWRLVPTREAPGTAAPPDLGLDYTPSLHADLVLYTDLLDAQMAATEVLRLTSYLARAARERRVERRLRGTLA
jgi:hypothetical protein